MSVTFKSACPNDFRIARFFMPDADVYRMPMSTVHCRQQINLTGAGST
jgi:hypothetical protein